MVQSQKMKDRDMDSIRDKQLGERLEALERDNFGISDEEGAAAEDQNEGTRLSHRPTKMSHALFPLCMNLLPRSCVCSNEFLASREQRAERGSVHGQTHHTHTHMREGEQTAKREREREREQRDVMVSHMALA